MNETNSAEIVSQNETNPAPKKVRFREGSEHAPAGSLGHTLARRSVRRHPTSGDEEGRAMTIAEKINAERSRGTGDAPAGSQG
jgi:hypothetical protein